MKKNPKNQITARSYSLTQASGKFQKNLFQILWMAQRMARQNAKNGAENGADPDMQAALDDRSWVI